VSKIDIKEWQYWCS